MRRVLVLGGGAGGVAAANHLAALARELESALEIILVNRNPYHHYAAGLVGVVFGELEPEALERPLGALLEPGVRLVEGSVEAIVPEASAVRGSFGELEYDELIVALGSEPVVDPTWPETVVTPWTMSGATALRERLPALPKGAEIVISASLPYKCPPAPFDLAVRVRHTFGVELSLVHPWPVPLAPFGRASVRMMERHFAQSGVQFHGKFELERIETDRVTSRDGREVGFDLLLHVPAHRAPEALSTSPLAGSSGWMTVEYPSLTHPSHPNVHGVGDIIAAPLKAGFAGTLAAFEGRYVAERIAAKLRGAPPPETPMMQALCFLDFGYTGSLLHCDFTPAVRGEGMPACTIMPEMRYFRDAKALFAKSWPATLRAP